MSKYTIDNIDKNTLKFISAVAEERSANELIIIMQDMKANRFNFEDPLLDVDGYRHVSSLKEIILKGHNELAQFFLDNDMTFELNDWEKELADLEARIISKIEGKTILPSYKLYDNTRLDIQVAEDTEEFFRNEKNFVYMIPGHYIEDILSEDCSIEANKKEKLQVLLTSDKNMQFVFKEIHDLQVCYIQAISEKHEELSSEPFLWSSSAIALVENVLKIDKDLSGAGSSLENPE